MPAMSFRSTIHFVFIFAFLPFIVDKLKREWNPIMDCILNSDAAGML
jgi:hypothetical protein